MRSIAEFRSSPLFGAAVGVPTAIMLIFSLFNLTSAPDPARLPAAVSIGIVNADEGMVFPPIKVSERLLEGLGSRLPFGMQRFDDADAGRAALMAGSVAAVILFPPEFSKTALGSEPVKVSVLISEHLTGVEAQMGAQLSQMLQLGMAAGVSTLRLAMSEGRLPTGEMPAAVDTEVLIAATSPAQRIAAFVMSFTTWLAALVGGLLLVIASRAVTDARRRAAVRSVVPVLTLGLGTLALAVTVSGATGQWGLLLPVFLTVWPVALCLAWMFAGVIALLGLWVLVLLLPLAFYQAVLGGTQFPAAAAPEWLSRIAGPVPFDAIGAAYRATVFQSGSATLPWAWLLAAGAAGLVLIWVAAMVRKAG